MYGYNKKENMPPAKKRTPSRKPCKKRRTTPASVCKKKPVSRSKWHIFLRKIRRENPHLKYAEVKTLASMQYQKMKMEKSGKKKNSTQRGPLPLCTTRPLVPMYDTHLHDDATVSGSPEETGPGMEPKMLVIPFDFSEAPKRARHAAFHAALKAVPWTEYTIAWESGKFAEEHDQRMGDYLKHPGEPTDPSVVHVRPAVGSLTACADPEANVFNPDDMDYRLDHAYSMMSKTGSSRLIIPFRPYSHMQCLVNDGSLDEFSDVIGLTQKMVRKALRKGRPVRVITEGLEVGWLHVKIQTLK